MEFHRKVAIKIIDEFEKLLDRYNIKLPSRDREGNEEEAAIYGTEYFELEDKITDILDKMALTKNVRSAINTRSKFKLCNGHSFEEIKEGNMDKLDYNRAYDLACIEDEIHSISVYLGVYDEEFNLTYSIHSKKDFNDIWENSDAEVIEIKNLNSVDELEKFMKDKLAEYFIENREYIEKYSNELDESEMQEIDEEEETQP